MVERFCCRKRGRRRDFAAAGSLGEEGQAEEMFRRRGFLSLPMVVGAVVIGVVSGKAIFGPPLEEYWTKKIQEEASKEEGPSKS
ncbi:hypothetical protein Taro_028525 [Colocasia esculenta]|uniref:Uncharacterized protein n=1 Tax=Colocasia esculenta TaxID=4460 RepID=A0A843VS41_COLES|nr:hypothetical protein [Colocasia esculenta]